MQMPVPDAATIARRDEIAAALRRIVPGEGVIVAEPERRAYESDGLTAYRQPPLVVVLPSTVAQVASVLRYCKEEGIKIVPRGAGTSLSGGALPLADGVLLGLAAGYFGGSTDWTIMTVINVMLTFPFVLLALAVIAVLGPSLVNMIIVLGIAGWPIYARTVRAETLAIREREFVLAGRALGMSHLRLVFRQIVPNLVSLIVVIGTLQVAQVIVLESFLSFLGLGIQPPTPAWGNMLGEGRVYMLNSWWIAAFPGLAIFVTTLAINLMGNALRDWIDPHMKL
jgi:peptide/nickel transport system permease protein